MATKVEAPPADERAWLIRALLVLQSPRVVFAGIRDDSDAAAQSRGEAVLALVWLAGIAAVLASPQMSTLMDDPARNDIAIASIVIFLAGGMYGALAYIMLGGILHAFLRGLGATGSYRRSRHLLAFALTPLALSLVTFWVVRIAVEGRALFKYGGRDHSHLFADAFYVFVAWSVVLVAVGVRTVLGWSWSRTASAVGGATAVAALIVGGTSLL
jgi:Yip1 domain